MSMEEVKVAIIGSGPSGYTAAIYASRAQLAPVLYTGFEMGGQLMYTTDLENFPGFPEGVIGPKFMNDLRTQSEKFGTKIRGDQVTAVDFSQRPFKIWTNLPENVSPDDFKKADPEKLKEYLNQIRSTEPAVSAQTVIISTGASSIMLGIPGEEKFFGQGVSTCAVCDAAFYKEKNVFVVGGGDSAMEDTLALTKFASQVTIIHRREEFRASKIMQDRVLNNPKVNVLWKSNLTEILGDQKVEKIKVEVDGQMQEFPADGVFLAIGHKPTTRIFFNQVELDEHNYIVTRESLSKHGLEKAQAALDEKGLVKFPTMTSVEGVFAAGDVVDVRYKQAITAAAQGCQAAIDAERWLESSQASSS